MSVIGTTVPISPAPGDTSVTTGAGRSTKSCSTAPPSGELMTSACVPSVASAATSSETSTERAVQRGRHRGDRDAGAGHRQAGVRSSAARFSPVTERTSGKPCVDDRRRAHGLDDRTAGRVHGEAHRHAPDRRLSEMMRSPGAAAASIWSWSETARSPRSARSRRAPARPSTAAVAPARPVPGTTASTVVPTMPDAGKIPSAEGAQSAPARPRREEGAPASPGRARASATRPPSTASARLRRDERAGQHVEGVEAVLRERDDHHPVEAELASRRPSAWPSTATLPSEVG